MNLRLALAVVFLALLLAVVAGQNSLFQTTGASGGSPTLAECGPESVGCGFDTADAVSGAVIGHSVYLGGCADTDLHVVRYLIGDGTGNRVVVASWCR